MVKPDFLEKVDKRIDKALKMVNEKDKNIELYLIVERLANSDFHDKALEVAGLISSGHQRIEALCHVVPGIAIRAKQPERALRIINEAKELYSALMDENHKPRALVSIGRAYAFGGYSDDALKIIEMLPEESENEKSQILDSIVYTYLRGDKIDDAIQLANSIPNNCTRASSIYQIAKFLTEKGDYHRALEVSQLRDEVGKREIRSNIMENLAKSTERDIDIIKMKALKYIKKERNEEALSLINEGIGKLEEGLSIARIVKANGLIGRWDDSINMFNALREQIETGNVDKEYMDSLESKPLYFIGNSPEDRIAFHKGYINNIKTRLEDYPFDIKRNYTRSIADNAHDIALTYSYLNDYTEALFWYKESIQYYIKAMDMTEQLGERRREITARNLLNSVVPTRDKDLYKIVSNHIEGIDPKPVPGTDRIQTEIYEAYLDCMAALLREDYGILSRRVPRLKKSEETKELHFYRGLSTCFEGILSQQRAELLFGLSEILSTFNKRFKVPTKHSIASEFPICEEAVNFIVLANLHGLGITKNDGDPKYWKYIPKILFE